MIKKVEATGKTRDDAVAAAMRVLMEINPDITEVDVDVELLERSKTGLFGIGRTDARVCVSYDMPPEEAAKSFLRGLLDHIGVDCVIDAEPTADGINLNITGDNMGVVIGRRGDTLDALQYITSVVVNRDAKDHIRVTVDTEGYRKKREESLESLAQKVAARVMKYKKNVTLEPMNANERRVIHSALQDIKGITTYSLGSEPNRRVIVALAEARTGGFRGRRPAGNRPVNGPKPAPVETPRPTESPRTPEPPRASTPAPAAPKPAAPAPVEPPKAAKIPTYREFK